MPNSHFPGASPTTRPGRGKIIRSPYVTSQKFFLLNAFYKQSEKQEGLRKTFGINGIAKWNERYERPQYAK